MSEHNQPNPAIVEALRPAIESLVKGTEAQIERALAPLVARIEELERQVAELQGEQGESKIAGSKPTNRRHR